MRTWTPAKIRALKGVRKFATITCYDATSAALLTGKDFPLVLVGDSLGMTMQGNDSPLPVTVDHMIYHTQCVNRMLKDAMLITDMPFASYQAGDDEGVRNALRLIKEGGADGVKIEGGLRVVSMVRRLVDAGVPVCGHLGMTPQSCLAMGGFRVQCREEDAAKQLIEDALALQEAGCFAVVVECVPSAVGEAVTKALQIPVIGIGAGNATDAQIIVWQDMLGMTQGRTAKFVRHFGEVGQAIQDALLAYKGAVEESTYPNANEIY